MSGDVQMYRLKLGVGTENSGHGEWSYFEDADCFETAVLEALLEVEARGDRFRNERRSRIRAWFERVVKPLDTWGVRRLVAAERLVDGTWVDLSPTLVPPRVEFAAPASTGGAG